MLLAKFVKQPISKQVKQIIKGFEGNYSYPFDSSEAL
jgi:hypothetical protein